MGYTIRRAGSDARGIDWYDCDDCHYSTPLQSRMAFHISVKHPDVSSDKTVAELREIARVHDLPIRGTKAEVVQRLEEAGVL